MNIDKKDRSRAVRKAKYRHDLLCLLPWVLAMLACIALIGYFMSAPVPN